MIIRAGTGFESPTWKLEAETLSLGEGACTCCIDKVVLCNMKYTKAPAQVPCLALGAGTMDDMGIAP